MSGRIEARLREPGIELPQAGAPVTEFDESGRHARTAAGVASLPDEAAVEVEAAVDIA